MEERKMQKIALFRQLYQLDESEEEPEGVDQIDLILRHSKSTKHASEKKNPSSPSPILKLGRPLGLCHPLGRTTSAPLPQAPSLGSDEVQTIRDNLRSSPISTVNPVHDQAMVDGHVLSRHGPNVVTTKEVPKAKGKRKRGLSLEVIPESQQIFRGLMFYFIPNDDVAPSRRCRIRKTLERGALWAKEWKVGITHIVVDRNLNYNDILSFLKIPRIPSDVALVTENYTADCMSYQFVVNPNQAQYLVDGHPRAGSIEDLATQASLVARSLLPKPVDDNGHSSPQDPSETGGNASSSNCMGPHIDEAAQLNEQIPKSSFTEFSRNFQDALDEVIQEAKAIKNLPLDFDEDENPALTTGDDDSDQAHSGNEGKRVKLNKYSDDRSWQENFSCMHKHDGIDNTNNPNARTIEILQQMTEYYGRTNDRWRAIAYRKAIAALRKQRQKILTKKEAFAIPFIGERLAAKIEEIVWTDRLRRLENTNLEPADQTLQMYLKIYGVGYAQASTWIDHGHRTLEDLTNNAHLTKNQLVGIQHYQDFLTRIPREEVEHHGRLVGKVFCEVDESIKVTIGGSYRRGATDSGDVDFIITKPECSIDFLRTIVVETVIPRLKQDDYIKVALADTSKDGSKWHGAAALPGSAIWRRIDFLLVPWEELGAALIYFTGNDIFNRSIRLLASKKGMRLNQHGLWRDVVRGMNRERITQGSLVESKCERKIFEVLGVPWRPPEHRIC